MLSSFVAVAIFFSHSCYGYSVPRPEIIAYKTRGFSVSIPDESGIHQFAFYANVNKKFNIFREGIGEADFADEVTEPVNGKWTYRDTRTSLKVGDTIYYFLHVKKDSLGYLYRGDSFTITELVPSGSTFDDVSTMNADFCSNGLNTLCLQSLFNITLSFLQLQSYTEVLQKKNIQLRQYIEQSPSAKKLTLSGKIPPDGHPSTIVSFVLREKLNMNPVIVQAQRHLDGSITFKVATIDDKLEIIDAAKTRLTSTKIFIK